MAPSTAAWYPSCRSASYRITATELARLRERPGHVGIRMWLGNMDRISAGSPAVSLPNTRKSPAHT